MKNRIFTIAALTCLGLAPAAPALALVTDLADEPLVTSAPIITLPNLMFVLDDSGSMAWEHMPDNASDSGSSLATFVMGFYGLRSSQCNALYYNPAFTYLPPVYADGTSYPAAVFTGAYKDGYKGSVSGTVNLSTSFRAEDDDSGSTAYYYVYSGTQTTPEQKDHQSTTNTYYYECASASGAAPGVNVFSKVILGSSASAAAKQNFANWYSYYRTRMLAMKSAAGHAFKTLDGHYRVGIMAINSTSTYLNLDQFEGTHRANWYAKLYGSPASGGTPLRTALAKAGRLYAGGLNGTTIGTTTVSDPIEYSCQQNFTILSTDGYWNTDSSCASGWGCKLNNSTKVGNQDGTEIRPYYDGSTTTVTRTTPKVTVERKQSVTRKTTTTTSSRYLYGRSSSGACGGNTAKYDRRYTQQSVRTKVEATTEVSDVTTTVNQVVVIVNGEVVSITNTAVAGSPSSTRISLNTATISDSATAWTTTSTKSYSSCYTSPSPNPTESSAGTPSVVTDPVVVTVLSTNGPTVGTTTETANVVNASSDSLADVAEYYYMTDLRTADSNPSGVLGINVHENNVPAGGQDTASWQHMTTFTLGFGARGKMIFSPSYLQDTSGDYHSVRNGVVANPPTICSWQQAGSGACNWPVPGMTSGVGKKENIDDLWHAAVNGRGTYFSADDPSSLATGLASVLAGASARLGSAAAAATSNPNVSAGDNYVFSSTFTTQQWDGEMFRQQLDLSTGELSETVDWTARSQLDARDWTARIIYTYDATAIGGTRLKAFTWSNLNPTESSYFSGATLNALTQFCTGGTTCLSAADKLNAAGANLINFLRGDRTNEGPVGAPNKFYRARAHVLGDIVSSEAVFVKGSLASYADPGFGAFKTGNAARTPMLYVGGNDGMLHAFDATTGAERWAFVPTLVMPRMFKLADKNYAGLHEYLVDGSPVVGDVWFGSAWHTILVGGLNGGGRGYYALDVTDPANPRGLWQFTDANLGYTYGNPVITKLKDGTWVVLVASGYNNVATGDGVGRLYVLDVATGTILRQIATSAGSVDTPSGLARITAWVDNAAIDNTVLWVYGGDLLGNLWRFDVNGDVGASGYDAQLLAKLADGSDRPQPISAKPEIGEINGYAVVFVGTGRFLGTSDLDDSTQQTMYAIKDPRAPGTVPATAIYDNPRDLGSDVFVAQTDSVTTCPSGTPVSICGAGQSVRTSSNNAVNFSLHSGWYLDFAVAGERANTDPALVFGTLVFTTNKPELSECMAGGYSLLYFVDYRSGAAVSSATHGVVGKLIGNAFATRPTVVQLPNLMLRGLIRMSDGTTVVSDIPIGAGSTATRRVSWRELVTD